MNQILFYSKILLLLFIGTNCIFPKDYEPLNKPKQLTLTISDRDRVYYKLDKSSPLEFNKNPPSPLTASEIKHPIP